MVANSISRAHWQITEQCLWAQPVIRWRHNSGNQLIVYFEVNCRPNDDTKHRWVNRPTRNKDQVKIESDCERKRVV